MHPVAAHVGAGVRQSASAAGVVGEAHADLLEHRLGVGLDQRQPLLVEDLVVRDAPPDERRRLDPHRRPLGPPRRAAAAAAAPAARCRFGGLAHRMLPPRAPPRAPSRRLLAPKPRPPRRVSAATPAIRDIAAAPRVAPNPRRRSRAGRWPVAEPARPRTNPRDGASFARLRDVSGLPEFARANSPLRTAARCPLFASAMTQPDHQRLLIVDFGSQVTQLIARRLREARIYCEIHPYQKVDAAFLAAFAPAGGDPLRRPGQRHRAGQPARRPRDLRPRRPGARHLLRPADDDGPARRPVEAGHHAEFGRAFVTPDRHRTTRCFTGLFADRPRGGLDEPRRPGHRARPRLRGDRRLAERPLRDHRRPRPPLLRRPVPPRGAPHRQRRPHPAATSPTSPASPATGPWPPTRTRRSPRSAPRSATRRVICGLSGGVDSLGRRGADPRGDRRPAHLRLRRHRPDAPGRGRGGRHPVPRPLQHPADPRRRERPLPRRARRRHRPRGQAQDHRPAVHRGLRGHAPRGRRRAPSSPRARSTPT